MNKIGDPKYCVNDQGQICNIATGKPIPDDEPIFILRAQDSLAHQSILLYMNTVATEQHKTAVKHRATDFYEFSQKHPDRMKSPDTKYPFPNIPD